MEKTAFVSFTAEVITPAHLSLMKRASELGRVIVGLMTDQALWGKRALPVLTVAERAEILAGFQYVDEVVLQREWTYTNILEQLKPDFFVHGDRWDVENSSSEVSKQIGKWGGSLVEIPFRDDLRWTEPSHRSGPMTSASYPEPPSPDSRRTSLRRAMEFERPILALEAHNALSAMVVESSQASKDGNMFTFDAIWSSSLTDSTSRGFPDIEALSFDLRLANIREIFRVSKKPLIMDLDTGGEAEVLALKIQELEKAGVSAGVVEDKVGQKKNSLLGNDVKQFQAPIETFVSKIKEAKAAQVSRDFMLVARVESLILEAGLRDAIDRSFAYTGAGADAIMIHSRHPDPSEIFEFLREFRAVDEVTPIFLVPTSYNSVSAQELYDSGANVVIYANHLLRAAVPAMASVARRILEDGRSKESEAALLSINQILELIPGTK